MAFAFIRQSPEPPTPPQLVMLENVDKVLVRGEKLQALADKSEELQSAANQFRAQARAGRGRWHASPSTCSPSAPRWPVPCGLHACTLANPTLPNGQRRVPPTLHGPTCRAGAAAQISNVVGERQNQGGRYHRRARYSGSGHHHAGLPGW